MPDATWITEATSYNFTVTVSGDGVPPQVVVGTVARPQINVTVSTGPDLSNVGTFPGSGDYGAATVNETLIALVTRKAEKTEVAALIGDTSALTTVAKNSLVGAINELEARPSSAGTAIDDSAASLSTTYSSSKTETLLAALVASSPETLNTLNELAAALGNDANFSATIAGQIGALQSTSATLRQDLTSTQTAATALTQRVTTTEAVATGAATAAQDAATTAQNALTTAQGASTAAANASSAAATASVVVKYDAASSSWPARPSTTRTVFWLAFSESAPDPAGLQAFDLVIKGPIS